MQSDGRRPTIREVAERAGCSVGTVSRALNGYRDVAQPTRDRVRQAAADLEYRPESAARSLVTRRTQVIGAFLDTGEDRPDLHHPFFHEVLVGFKEVIGEAGYDLLLFARSPGSDLFGPQSHLDRCRQRGVDGAVVMGAIPASEAARLVRSEVPCVGLDVDLGEGAPFVSSDNIAGAERAVDHLHALGHRRIATITGLLTTRPGADRLHGYQSALRHRGLTAPERYQAHGDFYAGSGHQAMAGLLALPDPPTAVFAASDLMAIGALRAAELAGLRVPDDISVVGYDDISVAGHLNPPLTTIRQDKVDLGRSGARVLLEEIEGGHGERESVTVPVELVVRGSTTSRPGQHAGTDHLHRQGRDHDIYPAAPP